MFSMFRLFGMPKKGKEKEKVIIQSFETISSTQLSQSSIHLILHSRLLYSLHFREHPNTNGLKESEVTSSYHTWIRTNDIWEIDALLIHKTQLHRNLEAILSSWDSRVCSNKLTSLCLKFWWLLMHFNVQTARFWVRVLRVVDVKVFLTPFLWCK